MLLLGLALVVLVTVAGRSDVLTALLAPPMPARLFLGVAALIVGVLLVLASADRMRTDREPRGLVRAIRLMFVAIGAFAAGAGWLFGSPVPVIAGLVIIAVDLLETSFLLLVTGPRSKSGASETQNDE
jgi:hypothetical protein